MLLGEPGRLTKLRVVVAMGSSRRGSESGKGTPKSTKRQAKVKETAKQEKIRKRSNRPMRKAVRGAAVPGCIFLQASLIMRGVGCGLGGVPHLWFR